MGFYGYFGLDAKNGGRLWEADQNGRHDGQGQGEDHNVLEPLVEYAPVKLQVPGGRPPRRSIGVDARCPSVTV